MAAVFGIVSIIPFLMGWHARRRLKAFLDAPLTPHTGDMTHVWEERSTRWNTIGLWIASFSILCSVLWLVSRLIL
jgi:hypothetical protein